MRNYLALVLALTVVSSSAHASRARLESLGESDQGSYYIDDSRDIFLNPAQIVHYKKKLFLELGSEPGGVEDRAIVAQRGEGGFTNTFGDFTYGLYLNNNSDRTARIITGANAYGHLAGTLAATDNFLAPDSTAELFFAGEAANMNWGISVFYAGNNARGMNSTTNTSIAASDQSVSQATAHLLGLRAGVEAGNLQVFGLMGLSEDAKVMDATNDEISGHFSWDLAATYKADMMTYIARTSHYGADISEGGQGTTQDRNHMYGLGMGYKHDVTKTVTAYTRLEADYLQTSNTGGIAQTLGVNTTDKIWNVPLVLAAEAQALSWLAIRGSISQSLLGSEMMGSLRNNLQGTTTVSAGLGLTFGDIQIDGLVATNGTANPAVTGVNGTGLQPIPGMGTAPQSNNSFGNNLLSRIAMTYNF